MDRNKFKYSMVLPLEQQHGDPFAPSYWRKVGKYCTFEEVFEPGGDKILRRVVSLDRTSEPITPGHRVGLTGSWRALEAKNGHARQLASVLLPCRTNEGEVRLR